jgi:hypothetical protein
MYCIQANFVCRERKKVCEWVTRHVNATVSNIEISCCSEIAPSDSSFMYLILLWEVPSTYVVLYSTVVPEYLISERQHDTAHLQ